MNDKELADAVVELGIDPHAYSDGMVKFPAEYFLVRDWRVAGALMEKMTGELTVWEQIYDNDSPVWIVETFLANVDGRNESLPRAITEACVEALRED